MWRRVFEPPLATLREIVVSFVVRFSLGSPAAKLGYNAPRTSIARGTNLSSNDLPHLPHHKFKTKIKVGQRACNEKNEKGKICAGHLKRWFYSVDVKEQACGDVEKAFGPDAEIYRCEHCQTLYLPHPDAPRGMNVAGSGQLSVFGLTVAPKPQKEAPAKDEKAP